MNRDEALELLRGGWKGIEEWNSRRVSGEEIPSLHGVDLKESLMGANLSEANLMGSRLWRADLSDANLMGARLIEADLRGTHIDGANLSGAHIDGASLSGARLIEANFSGAHIDGADFADTLCRSTVFADVDLSSVDGLEDVKHLGPSYIDVSTLYKSRGKIPEVFLRGCGVPENLIEFLPSLVSGPNAIQFYSCFISYSGKDEEFAKRLHSRMREEKMRVWFAPEDIKGGEKLHEQIDEAIRLHDKLLLVLSNESMGSEWVKIEIRKARQRELREKRRMLFPIRLVSMKRIQQWECIDGKSGTDLAAEICEYFIPDFSNWKDHDAFEEGFARLLRDLQAGDAEHDQGT